MCQFAGFPLNDIPSGGQGLHEMLQAKYGQSFSPQYLAALGKRVLRAERDFNLRAGLTKDDDRLPEFFYTEALPPHNKPFLVKNEDMDRLFDF
jgi:aldehyde:ferredoxin oxidoreductase